MVDSFLLHLQAIWRMEKERKSGSPAFLHRSPSVPSSPPRRQVTIAKKAVVFLAQVVLAVSVRQKKDSESPTIRDADTLRWFFGSWLSTLTKKLLRQQKKRCAGIFTYFYLGTRSLSYHPNHHSIIGWKPYNVAHYHQQPNH